MAGLVMGVASYAIMHKMLLVKLKQISEVAQQFSNKDLTKQCDLDSDDMIGDIIGSFNSMAADMRQLMKRVNSSVNVLCENSHSMRENSAQLSEGVQSQQAKSEAVLDDLHFVTEHNKLVSDTAEQACGTAIEVDGVSLQGFQLMTKAQQSIQSLETELHGIVGIGEATVAIAQSTLASSDKVEAMIDGMEVVLSEYKL